MISYNKNEKAYKAPAVSSANHDAGTTHSDRTCNNHNLLRSSRPPLINHPCYKVMTWTTFLDIVNMVSAMWICGALSIFKVHHCSHGIWVMYYSQYVMCKFFGGFKHSKHPTASSSLRKERLV
uniref:Very-long-chain 3-oxoacyl-CoA synthase n=1 Tax=Steinernema glaseri TaxID=37863 RepID=A0A1I8AKS3_9BILA